MRTVLVILKIDTNKAPVCWRCLNPATCLRENSQLEGHRVWACDQHCDHGRNSESRYCDMIQRVDLKGMPDD
jgi:hypothetical protein